MLNNQTHLTNINTPVRQIQAKAELYNGSALLDTYPYNGDLISFEIERVGEAKFFGFGICQKVNIKLLDIKREKNITTSHSFKIHLGVNGDYLTSYPEFFTTEVNRDENTNQLSITAYDVINKAAAHHVAELTLGETYTIEEFANQCAVLLGANGITHNMPNSAMLTAYEGGANFEGSETIREALDAVAEATQSIYYLTADNYIHFKRLDLGGDAVYTIDKSRYMELDSKTNRRLVSICHATELGDNVEASLAVSGSKQFVRDNPFWDMREDIGSIVEAALAAIGGLTINQFECNWRGNYLLELGDKIALTTKDNDTTISYLLDDVVSYDGTFSQKSRWSYADNEEETSSNPSTLGEALKQTYAKVDKINKEIDLVASETDANGSRLSQLELSTEGINATVQTIERTTKDAVDNLNQEIEELTKRVNASITSDEVIIEIQKELENGITKVETNTGFTFNDEGLTVEKSNSEMKTQITEDGMKVFKNDDEVLVADNTGVKALNLHATTYLIIGTYSRFEDYNIDGQARTGCFWIGEQGGN